jgi:type VI secretion system protein ImpI
MYLTFEVISANASALGAHRRKVFTVDGGRIGRAPDNDMVLPGVGVHRHHATVRFINGVFFVEGVGTNGIAINDPDRVLPRNEPYPLKTGDKVFIDEYEVQVTASATAPAEPARPAARESARSGVSESAARPSVPIVGIPAESAEDLDPLRKLTAGNSVPAQPHAPSRPAPQRPVDSAWNHTSSLQDHFTPPAPASNLIPENWDRTSFDRSKLQVPPAQTSQPISPQRAAAGAAPYSGSQSAAAGGAAYSGSLPAGGGAPYSAAASAPVGGAPSSVSPPATRSPSSSASSSSSAHAAPMGAGAVSRASQPPSNQRAASSSSSAAAATTFDWDGFLRSTGVDPSRVPPETAAAMGNIMRSVVQGLIEVLRARSEIKTEFRMPVTQVKVSENNPLKFAANAEDAIGNLLGRRNPAYLAPQEAFEDAFNDVRFHQLAMLAGVRAGFENLMNRFDPAQLQEQFDRTGKRGGLFGSGKASYWDRYSERYQEMAADRDETFRRLFGEEFARAYEQQLSVLKRSRGGHS